MLDRLQRQGLAVSQNVFSFSLGANFFANLNAHLSISASRSFPSLPILNLSTLIARTSASAWSRRTSALSDFRLLLARSRNLAHPCIANRCNAAKARLAKKKHRGSAA
jgi:hypothetical protein